MSSLYSKRYSLTPIAATPINFTSSLIFFSKFTGSGYVTNQGSLRSLDSAVKTLIKSQNINLGLAVGFGLTGNGNGNSILSVDKTVTDANYFAQGNFPTSYNSGNPVWGSYAPDASHGSDNVAGKIRIVTLE